MLFIDKCIHHVLAFLLFKNPVWVLLLPENERGRGGKNACITPVDFSPCFRHLRSLNMHSAGIGCAAERMFVLADAPEAAAIVCTRQAALAKVLNGPRTISAF
jgi:hypothetical protein